MNISILNEEKNSWSTEVEKKLQQFGKLSKRSL